MRKIGFTEIGRLDELSRLDSAIHRLDPRTKVLATAVFLGVVMSFPRHAVAALMPLFAYPLLVGARAGLPSGFLLRKILVASPFALLVASGNPFFDRAPLAFVGGHGIAGGWFSFASIMVRFVLTLWSALVLIATTGIHPLCAGLEQLGMPRIFGTQVLFLYRYLFVIAEQGARLHRAVTLRGGGTLRLAAYGSLLGQWLLRAIDRATRIHQAMCARGFDGQVRILRRRQPTWRDPAFLVAWSVFFLVARRWDLGEILTAVFTPAAT